MRLLLWVFSFLFLPQMSFAQGNIDGFYKRTSEGTVVLGGGFEDSKKYIAGDTKLDLERSTYYAALFTSYGISDDLDINLSVPYIVSNQQRNFQDLSLFLKYRIASYDADFGRLEISVAGGFSTPISNYDIGGLNDIGQQATILDTRGMLHFMAKSSWFATLQSGYSYKLEEVPNSLPATLKVGRATSRWYYDVYYDYQYSFGGIDYRGTPAPQNFKEFGVDFHKIGGTLFKPFSSQFGGYVSLSYTLSGRNTFLGAAYGLGLSYNFQLK